MSLNSKWTIYSSILLLFAWLLDERAGNMLVPILNINDITKLNSINKHLNEEYYDDPIIEYTGNLFNKKTQYSPSKIFSRLLLSLF